MSDDRPRVIFKLRENHVAEDKEEIIRTFGAKNVKLHLEDETQILVRKDSFPYSQAGYTRVWLWSEYRNHYMKGSK